jgi:hypothetical protein
LKDKAFSTLPWKKALFEARPEMGFACDESLFRQWPVIDSNAIKRLAKGTDDQWSGPQNDGGPAPAGLQPRTMHASSVQRPHEALNAT